MQNSKAVSDGTLCDNCFHSGMTAKHPPKLFSLHDITTAELWFFEVLMWNFLGSLGEGKEKKDNHKICFLFCILFFPFFSYMIRFSLLKLGEIEPTNSVQIISNCSRKRTLRVYLKNRKNFGGQHSIFRELVFAWAELLLWFFPLNKPLLKDVIKESKRKIYDSSLHTILSTEIC